MESWPQLQSDIIACERCPRLREHCVAVAERRKQVQRRFDGQTYWAKPVPNFGGPDARILFLGLAPAAHGANRTGRMFTGDRSGDFLYFALHAVGLASQPAAVSAEDGLALIDCAMTASVRCAPPANKPTLEERANCAEYTDRTLALMKDLRVIVALGGIGFDESLKVLQRAGHPIPKPRPKFGHRARYEIGPITLLGCFHPSQQNTFTGRLTQDMLQDVLQLAKEIARL